MTIDEALKRLENLIKTLPFTLAKGEKDAVQLGIEALKEVKDNREYPSKAWIALLPGETEK